MTNTWTLTKTHGLTDEGRRALSEDLDDVANTEMLHDDNEAVEAEMLRRIGGKKNLVKYVDTLLAGRRPDAGVVEGAKFEATQSDPLRCGECNGVNIEERGGRAQGHEFPRRLFCLDCNGWAD